MKAQSLMVDSQVRRIQAVLTVNQSISYHPVCVELQEERSKVDDLRGTPMSVGTLEEIIDDNHAIVSTSVGSEHYVSILSFVDKDQLEPGCSVLLNHKVPTCFVQITVIVVGTLFFATVVLCTF